jgi:hypothetical protein
MTQWLRFAFTSILAAASLLSLAPDAKAQPYPCGSPGHPFGGTCMLAFMPSSVTAVGASGSNASAGIVFGNDTGNGLGVGGASATGIGVSGVSTTASYSLPSGIYGGYFLAGGTGNTGIFSLDFAYVARTAVGMT